MSNCHVFQVMSPVISTTLLELTFSLAIYLWMGLLELKRGMHRRGTDSNWVT